MSLYNALHGVTPAVILALPAIGLHPRNIPRFRDVFLEDDDHPEYTGLIQVYTRVGGNNRGQGYGEEALEARPDFVATYDDAYDSTFGTYVFRVPPEYEEDMSKLVAGGQVQDLSPELQQKCREMWPELNDQLDLLWPRETPDQEKEGGE